MTEPDFIKDFLEYYDREFRQQMEALIVFNMG